MTRKMTKQIICGGVAIGGGAPIAIQSMTNTFTADVSATVGQILELADAGCDIVRCAVPDGDAAAAITKIKRELTAAGVKTPIVADIHFNYRLAIDAINAGADKIRINPGNIGDTSKIRSVVNAAKNAGVPIRIGVNSGSLERDIEEKHGGATAGALAESALRNVDLIRDMGFDDLVISIKSTDVTVNTEAMRILSKSTDLPLHIGITEAGIGDRAVIKSAIGIGSLLVDGIGDTIRVSLTGNPVPEVNAAKDILASLNLLPRAVNIISCPTCGRCKVDLATIADEVRRRATVLEASMAPLTVAIMGCAVNGPGEASHADIGVACGDGNAVLFKRGEIVRTIAVDEIADTLIEELREL